MNALLFNGGVVAGLIGMLLMAVAVAGRLAGHFTMGGFATGTMMLAGIGAISAGCFLLLWAVADQLRKQR
jgi:uncharacterized membrane protein